VAVEVEVGVNRPARIGRRDGRLDDLGPQHDVAAARGVEATSQQVCVARAVEQGDAAEGHAGTRITVAAQQHAVLGGQSILAHLLTRVTWS
jgi:hypothetical protein